MKNGTVKLLFYFAAAIAVLLLFQTVYWISGQFGRRGEGETATVVASEHYSVEARATVLSGQASSGPSKSDLKGCSSKLEYPQKNDWLNDYETRYVSSTKGGGIYLCYKPGEDSFCLLEDDTEVTVLARRGSNSLVKTEYGDIGWCLSDKLEKVPSSSCAPSNADLRGCSSELEYPQKNEWLDDYETRYVSSTRGGGIYLCYTPAGEDSICLLEDDTEVTVLARRGRNSLVKTEYGDIGWCLSDKLKKVEGSGAGYGFKESKTDPLFFENAYVNISTIRDGETKNRYYSFSYDYPCVTISDHGLAADKINDILTKDENKCEKLFREENDGDFRLYRKTTVSRLDSRVLSLVYEDSTEFSWSAHGSLDHSGRVFNLTTGEELTIRSMAKNKNTIEKKLLDWLLIRCENEPRADYFFFGDIEKELSDLLKSPKWYFDETGLTFVVDTSSSIALTEGPLLLTVPYEELKELIREEYLPESSTPTGMIEASFPDVTPKDGIVLTADNETELQGRTVLLKAKGTVSDVRVIKLGVDPSRGDFENLLEVGTLCAALTLRDGESILIYNFFPDLYSNLRVTCSDRNGECRFDVFESLKDGSIVLKCDR